MPNPDSNPYLVTSGKRPRPNFRGGWWKRFLVLNLVLSGGYGVIVVACFVALRGGAGMLSGVTLVGSLEQFWIEALFLIGLAFGVPNSCLLLWGVVSNKRN
jgi:hypothetical protein